MDNAILDFVFFTPTLNRFTDCNNLIESVITGTKKPVSIEVLDNSGGGFSSHHDVQITISEINLGVARSFNYALDLAVNEFPDTYLIISNDDIVVYPDTLEFLSKGILENPDKLVYCSDLKAANSFSFFCVKPQKVLSTVGWFEIAYHSYLEDTDFMHRARMLGYDLFPVPGCRVKDHVGSGTLQSFTPEQETAFHSRRARGIDEYTKKWGALPEYGELYTTPYNLGIDAVTWHREKFKRVHPYNI